MQLQPNGTNEAWQTILPLDNPSSSFFLNKDGLYFDGEILAKLVAWENDDVVLSYLRNGGRALTLNTNSRSICTGCLFCPNVIEDASDATVNGVSNLSEILAWIQADNDWRDLSGVDVITISSGCFNHPDAAVKHMTDLREAARQDGFQGRLHLLSSVVREKKHLEQLASSAGPFHLTLTLECFTRRNLLLKDSKASLTIKKACRILDECRELGIRGDFTYVAGLDPFASAVEGLRCLAPHVTTFPRIQVFQAHNDYMRTARNPVAEHLKYFLDIRNAIENDYAGLGLRPVSWENYRPLWYSTFAGEVVNGPRI